MNKNAYLNYLEERECHMEVLGILCSLFLLMYSAYIGIIVVIIARAFLSKSRQMV